jgi:hypothetical protein
MWRATRGHRRIGAKPRRSSAKGREFPVYRVERRRQKENAFMRPFYRLFYFLFYFLGPPRNAHPEWLDAREPA